MRMVEQKTVVIIDPLRRYSSDGAKETLQLLLRCFDREGWRVVILHDADERGHAAPDAYACLKPARVHGHDDANRRCRATDIFDDLDRHRALLEGADLVMVPNAEPVHLEAVFGLVPVLELDGPLKAPAIFHFMGDTRHGVAKSEVDADTLALRLSTCSPFREIHLTRSGAGAAAFIERLGLPCTAIGQEDTQLPAETASALAQFGSRIAFAEASAPPPALRIERFAPLALVISAMWGKVGSTAIFNSQVSHLLSRGFAVARLYVDDRPIVNDFRQQQRIEARIGEDQEGGKPHFSIAMQRDTGESQKKSLGHKTEFLEASPVKRVGMILEHCITKETRKLNWARKHTALTVVNHIQHSRLASRLTTAPVILEAHDIYAELLNAHGIPGFVPVGPDSMELREREERAGWRQARLCIALTDKDHDVIAPHARCVIARPYITPRQPTRRCWPEVVAENQLSKSLLSWCLFDIMLWGSRHDINAKSISWFFDEVMPAIRAEARPRIVIAGSVVNSLPGSLTERGDVSVAGFVDHLEDIVSRTRILVIPDQGGTGRSIKLLDTLAWGACFACTADGFRGVDPGRSGYHPSRSVAELADDISRLLASEDERFARRAVARALYESNCSPAEYARVWDRALEEVIPKELGEAHRLLAFETPPSRAPANPAAKSSTSKMAGASPLRVSAVICTYNRYGVLPDALASLLGQECPDGFLEIIVIDNSPDQQMAAEFGARYAHEPRIRYVLEPAPGLSNARNVGIGHARADIIAFIDDDGIAAPEWASRIVEAFETYGKMAGAVGGRVTPRWVSPQPAWLTDDLLGPLSVVDWGGSLRRASAEEWFAGCNIAFDREALAVVGGFAKNLGRNGAGQSLLSNEENDVMRRIRASGRNCVYAPEALVEHVIDPDRLTPNWFRRRAAWQAVSDFIEDGAAASLNASQLRAHLRTAVDQRALHRQLGFSDGSEASEHLKQDVRAAYGLVLSLLSGASETGEVTPPVAWTTAEKNFDAKGRKLRLDRRLRHMLTKRLKTLIMKSD